MMIDEVLGFVGEFIAQYIFECHWLEPVMNLVQAPETVAWERCRNTGIGLCASSVAAMFSAAIAALNGAGTLGWWLLGASVMLGVSCLVCGMTIGRVWRSWLDD